MLARELPVFIQPWNLFRPLKVASPFWEGCVTKPRPLLCLLQAEELQKRDATQVTVLWQGPERRVLRQLS